MKAALTKQLHDIEEAITQLDKPKKELRVHIQFDLRQIESMKENPELKAKLNHELNKDCEGKSCLLIL